MIAVYIITNKNKTVLYTGVTNDLHRRLIEHHASLNRTSFASKYNCKYLLYFEIFSSIKFAIRREKEIKDLRRSKKFDLIKQSNPDIEFIHI